MVKVSPSATTTFNFLQRLNNCSAALVNVWKYPHKHVVMTDGLMLVVPCLSAYHWQNAIRSISEILLLMFITQSILGQCVQYLGIAAKTSHQYHHQYSMPHAPL